MMAGFDMLIQRGIADPERLGLFGHSYGAKLTAYSLTRTLRFKAAVVHEAVGTQKMTDVFTVPGSRVGHEMRRLYGVKNVFDPEFQRKMFEESFVFHMGRVSTPTL